MQFDISKCYVIFYFQQNVRHVVYVLLDAIFVRLIHWFAPVDIDQPRISCSSSAFATKKMPEERPALAMCYVNMYTLHSKLQRCTTFKQFKNRLNDVLVCGNVTQKMMLHKCGFLNSATAPQRKAPDIRMQSSLFVPRYIV
jgi:hypothetical protein